MSNPLSIVASLLAGAFALSSPSFADYLNEIKLPGDRAYPESIAAAHDGTLYVSSPAVGRQPIFYGSAPTISRQPAYLALALFPAVMSRVLIFRRAKAR